MSDASIEKEQKEQSERVKALFAEPTIEDFSDNALRVRRNLLFTGAIGFLYGHHDLTIDVEHFVGLGIGGITPDVFRGILTSILVYHIAHFGCYVVEHWQYLRIRLSGVKISFVTGNVAWDEPLKESPNNPKNASLYTWWYETKLWLKDKMPAEVERLKNELNELKAELNGVPSPTSLDKKLDKIESLLNGWHQTTLQRIGELLQNGRVSKGRIEESLERFDHWYRDFIGIQLARFLLLEVGLPIVVGVAALIVIWR